MKQSIPPGIGIIYSISKQLNLNHEFLISHSKKFQILQTILKESSKFDDDTRFLNSPDIIAYMQLSLLLGMSMFGGVLVTSLTSFTDKEGKVSFTWDSGTSDCFKWGKYDKDFIRFFKYYQDRLSSSPQHKNYLPTNILWGISGFLKSYLLILSTVETKIDSLLGSKSTFLSLFNDSMNRDLLFIIISSMPSDQINALYLYLHHYFPEDMSVTTPNGRTMNLVSMFNSPSQDIHFLIEKTKIFLDLYFNKNMPIIQNIAVTKSKEYVEKLCDNNKDFNTTQESIRLLKKSQIDPRFKLYSTFSTHLDQLLNHN